MPLFLMNNPASPKARLGINLNIVFSSCPRLDEVMNNPAAELRGILPLSR